MRGLDFSKWLHDGFESLPRCKDEFFLKLWHNGRMRYAKQSNVFDTIDELSARLICSTLVNKNQTLLLLPDGDTRRPAALFATALIMSSIDSMSAGRGGGSVLYFGTKIGIRTQLSDVSIKELSLSSVFSQSYGRGDANKHNVSGNLPHVICVYSPLDPLDLVSSHNPRWVALDCSDSSSIAWVIQLLPYLKDKDIPLIAWSSNPLSSLKKEFITSGQDIFKWPPFMIHPQIETKRNSAAIEVLDALSEPIQTVDIVPCVLTTQEADNTSDRLKKAQKCLAEGMSKVAGRMENDALLVGWKYFRALERLTIPLDVYEAESMHFWGVRPIGQIKTAFEKFVSASGITSSMIIENLEGAKHYLNSTYEAFQNSYPPRWDALIELCLEEVPEEFARVLVFPGPSHKSMFTYALLSRENTTINDLADLGVFLLSFKEASDLIYNANDHESEAPLIDEEDDNIRPPHWSKWNLIHVTMPSHYHSERIIPFLGLRKFEMLLYPYQLNTLSRKATEWSNELDIDVLRLCKCFKQSQQPMGLDELHKKDKLFARVSDVRTIAGRTLKKKFEVEVKPIWEPRSDAEEVAFILSNKEDDISMSDHDVFFDQTEDVDSGEALVENVLEVRFDGRWVGTFELNTKINVIRHTPQGTKIESCYIRALRNNDRILYIYGQKRQSLYDLVLSRVHSHPSIEIHLALIRQWQSEILQAFSLWLQNGKSLDDLYNKMQENGTHLQSSLAMRYWIKGLTLRPDDPEDLKRIAEILTMPFTRTHYKRIHLAGNRIHRLHISLSLRLNSWIQQGASKTDMQNDIIDQATGLSFTDVRDSLILLKVESMFEKQGLYDKANLNKIERET